MCRERPDSTPIEMGHWRMSLPECHRARLQTKREAVGMQPIWNRAEQRIKARLSICFMVDSPISLVEREVRRQVVESNAWRRRMS